MIFSEGTVKKVKRCLIMITTSFPFAAKEPYLEAEMPRLANEFDRIFLFTIGLDKGVSPTAPVPENVIVCNPSKTSSKVTKLLSLIKGIPCIWRFPKDFKKEKKACGKSLVKRLFSGYLISRSKLHCKEIADCISGFDFSVFDETVLYGYWLFAATATALMLKEKLPEYGAENISVFSRAHSYDVYDYANRLNFLPLREFLLEGTDRVFTCSEDGCRYITERYPDYADKVSVSYLGTDGGHPTKGSSDGVFRILTCSRTIPLKRLDRLADSLALLKDSALSLSWTHIGDGSALEDLKRKAEEKLSFMNVSFKGMMRHDSVIDYIGSNSFDLFINVSEREGLPVSVMEALSFSIPSLVTDVGGCREIIEDGKNGFLIPADFSNETLANIIEKCASDTEFGKMRNEAYSSWKKKFSAEKNYGRFVEAISNKSTE